MMMIFIVHLMHFFHSSMNIETSRLRASIIDVLSFDNQIELESEICNLDNLDSPCHYYFSDTFNEKLSNMKMSNPFFNVPFKRPKSCLEISYGPRLY